MSSTVCLCIRLNRVGPPLVLDPDCEAHHAPASVEGGDS